MMAFAIMAFFQGPMRIEGISSTSTLVFSNKATYVAYRGPWATGDFLRERLLDIVAAEVGVDRVEIRRRNYVVRDEPPLAMLTGKPFVGVTTRECVEQAVERDRVGRLPRPAGRRHGPRAATSASGWRRTWRERRARRARATWVTRSATRRPTWPSATTAASSSSRASSPTGRATRPPSPRSPPTSSGCGMEDVEIRWGDTDITPVAMIGTGGSRAATMANGAVLHGSRSLRAKILALAAEIMEANPADLEIRDSIDLGAGARPRPRCPSPSWPASWPRSPVACPTTPTSTSRSPRCSTAASRAGPGGTHCCIVEVDVETGLVEIERYVVIEDCGIAVNPGIVDGQIRGGVAQGIGAVLLEHAAYGDDGNYLAASFMDYLLPTSTIVPKIEIHHVEPVLTDPDVNFRGVGEGGMIVAPATVVSAIEDALAPFGVKVREQHLPPSRIVELTGGMAR